MNTTFGEKLKELRTEKRLTQKQIALLFNVSKTTICQWETHRQEPSIDDIIKTATFFNVTTDYLFGLEDEDGTKINNYNNYGIHNGDVKF